MMSWWCWLCEFSLWFVVCLVENTLTFLYISHDPLGCWRPPRPPKSPTDQLLRRRLFFLGNYILYIIVWGQIHRGTVCLVIDIAVFPFILQILQLSWLGAEYMMKTWLGWPFQWRLSRKRPSVGSSETEKAENSKNSPFGLDVDTFNEHI